MQDSIILRPLKDSDIAEHTDLLYAPLTHGTGSIDGVMLYTDTA